MPKAESPSLPAPVMEAVLRVLPRVDEVLARYESDGCVIAAWEAFLDIVMSEPSLYWVTTCDAEHVGCVPSNRSGLGLVVYKMFELLIKHKRSGYSYKKASEYAFATTPPTGAAEFEEALRVNREQSDMQPVLPALLSLVLMSISGSHSNGAIRLVKGKASCSNTDLAPTGSLDPDHLVHLMPGIKQALNPGLTWKVIHYAIFQQRPKILEISVTALNNKSHTEVAEEEGLLAIVSTADKFRAGGVAVDWNQCLDACLTSEPFWAPWASSLIEIAKVTPTEAVKELCQLTKILCPKPDEYKASMGHLGQNFLSKIAALKWPGLMECPRVRNATVLANIMSPVDKIDSGRYTLISPADVASLNAKKTITKVGEIESIMNDARELCKKLKTDEATKLKLVGSLDVRLVMHVMGKGKKSAEGKDYANVWEVCRKFLDDVKEAVPAAKCADPWLHLKPAPPPESAEAAPKAKAPSPSATHVSQAMNSVAGLRDPLVQLKILGYECGVALKMKKPTNDTEKAMVYKITLLTETGATITPVSNAGGILTDIKVDDLNNLIKDWAKVKFVEPTVVHWGGMSALENVSWEIDQLKAVACLSLRHLTESWEKDMLNNVECVDNPKNVTFIGKTPVKKNNLVLVPCTRSISVRSHTDHAPSHAVDLGAFSLKNQPNPVQLHLSPVFSHAEEKSNKWVAPFWFVSHADPVLNEQPNVMMSTKSVTLGWPVLGPNWTMKIPVIMNTRQLAAGDKLLLPPIPKADDQAAKRAAEQGNKMVAKRAKK